MIKNVVFDNDDDDLVKIAKIQRLRNFEIRPILPSSLQTEHIEMVEAVVLTVTNKSLFSPLLRILPQLAPEFDHLKRINGTDVLVKIGPSNGISEAERTAIAELLGEEEPTFRIRHIPSRKPMCIKQLDIYKKKWPMSFHKNAKLESMIDGTFLSKTESSRITELFAIAERTKGALFYDPETDRVIAEGMPSSQSVANDHQKPLAHPVLSAIEQLAAKLAKCVDRGTDAEQHQISPQYLATGFYAILAMEPCTMCAMALVHVRVKRVFFGSLNAKFGALRSKWRLQESPHINHHFDVFRIVENFK